ncbi:unnamed protein product [Blumeria hordei]|uniref:Uncharacterized protein n=1 Tax=Blumeria hordei TaxID=2867405 RepID=A0A383UJ60_BLUHO|nr:unnamed protein product [Blumeria hordei]
MSYLDQIIKGTSLETELETNSSSAPSERRSSLRSQRSLSPTHTSPPQIYLNLLILEASLRAQWLQLRTRRRQHTFFLALLAFWIAYFGYALFLAPREDGSGVGGSIYWVIDVGEKICLISGIITGILVWGTGQWERGIKWPRRWVYNTNRGLREFNCKVVIIKQSWWSEFTSMVTFLFSHGLFFNSGSSYRQNIDQMIPRENERAQKKGKNHSIQKKPDYSDGNEEDLEAGGDHVKLLLLPKPFSPNFRENWDIYRTEYWEIENERRANIRKSILDRERKIARQQGGIFWWTGYRGKNRGKGQPHEKERDYTHKHLQNEKDRSRFRSGSVRSGHQSLTHQKTFSSTESRERPSTPSALRDYTTSGKRNKGSSLGN